MPYFVFRISAERQLTLINTYEKFPEAMKVCRELRKSQTPGATDTIRMTFAKSEPEAKRLLSERRQPSSPLEEWEA
jgi:hypothetical protein